MDEKEVLEKENKEVENEKIKKENKKESQKLNNEKEKTEKKDPQKSNSKEKEDTQKSNSTEKEDTQKSNSTEKEEPQEANNKKEKENKKSENKTEFRQVKSKGKKKKEKKCKKSKLIICALTLIVTIILSTIFALININNENILNGVTIKGIDVSGLNKTEAISKLEKIYTEKLENEIEVKYEDYETTINLNVLETKYEIEKAVEKAIEIGKDSNIFINNYNILKTYILKQDIDVDSTTNEDILNQTIEDIGAKLPGIVVESSYYKEDNNLIIRKGTTGIVINNEEMSNKIKEEIKKIEISQNYIQIPVLTKSPDPIDIEKIHEEIHTEVQDAYYTKNPFEIHPEVEGVDFDIEAAKKILDSEEKEEYIIPLTITKPKVTINQIGTEAFPDQLAIFTTKYDGGNQDRTTNLRLACQKLNGKVILAGETFSYNKTLGERTVAAGYKNGKIYENGEVVDGIGGGICQISSTLYNAVLIANLDIVERRNHQFVTSYLPAGRDATVVYGATDFKFKNTRKYPIRLVANVNNGIATVAVYGIKEEEEYTVSLNTKTISTIPTTTKYVDDASIPAGQEKVKQKGANGLVSETYITKMLNGKVVSQKLLSRDTYSAMQKIVLRGVGGATTTDTKETQNSTPVTEQKEEEKPAETKPLEKPAENTGVEETE